MGGEMEIYCDLNPGTEYKYSNGDLVIVEKCDAGIITFKELCGQNANQIFEMTFDHFKEQILSGVLSPLMPSKEPKPISIKNLIFKGCEDTDLTEVQKKALVELVNRLDKSLIDQINSMLINFHPSGKVRLNFIDPFTGKNEGK